MSSSYVITICVITFTTTAKNCVVMKPFFRLFDAVNSAFWGVFFIIIRELIFEFVISLHKFISLKVLL